MTDETATTSKRAVRVAIVGAGNVGATCAYALLLNGTAAEIVLIDANRSAQKARQWT